jgi:hypothetical protein
MKRLGKIRYEFGTGIAVGAIWQNSDFALGFGSALKLPAKRQVSETIVSP